MLQVRLLGQFDVQRDGAPISIPSRLAQSLFAYLILTAGTAHRREELAGLLWPDTTDENARRNLRQELWRLRKAIESSAPGRGVPHFLLVDEITIAFDPQFSRCASGSVSAGVSLPSQRELFDLNSLLRPGAKSLDSPARPLRQGACGVILWPLGSLFLTRLNPIDRTRNAASEAARAV